MDKDTALRKIRKCLALSGSSEPNEAARALAQAQALMRQFDVEHPELLAEGVESERAKSRASERPPNYEAHLANVVAGTFGCDLIFRSGYAGAGIKGNYQFIGTGAAAKVAGYTFTVLARKLTVARAEYTATHLKRYRKNKVAAADTFCDGWVLAIATTVHPEPPSEQRRLAIDAYRGMHIGATTTLKTTSRELAERAAPSRHLENGYEEGKKAQVRTAVPGQEPPAQLGLSL